MTAPESNETPARNRPDVPAKHVRSVAEQPAVCRRHILLLVTGLFALMAVNARWAERVQVNDGLGWDGLRYADIVRDPHAAVLERATDSYTIQRVLPGVAVSALLAIVGAEPSNGNIVRGFVVFNAALILLGGVLWGVVARDCGLSLRAFIAGAVALFVNYAV